MLSRNLFLLAALATSLLTSCHKHNDGPSTPPAPRVKSMHDDRGATTYTYDEKWRLIKYDAHSDADNSIKEYTYTDKTVTVKNYDGSGKYLGTAVYQLNAQGLAISLIDESNVLAATYTYNSNNQISRLQLQRTTAGNPYSWDIKYFYNSSGDLDSSTTWASATNLITVSYYPQYDLTHPTTLGNENLGLSFLGSSSKHPLKQTTAQDRTVLFTYIYTYDPKGRIATQETSIGGVGYISSSIAYY